VTPPREPATANSMSSTSATAGTRRPRGELVAPLTRPPAAWTGGDDHLRSLRHASGKGSTGMSMPDARGRTHAPRAPRARTMIERPRCDVRSASEGPRIRASVRTIAADPSQLALGGSWCRCLDNGLAGRNSGSLPAFPSRATAISGASRLPDQPLTACGALWWRVQRVSASPHGRLISRAISASISDHAAQCRGQHRRRARSQGARQPHRR
jgi:hypothetical protein